MSVVTFTMVGMATALYRRYRPDTFADMIGQSQVTDPLMTALRTGRVNHAYLFSGPRGCGKTSSARILARCLNCAEGPTDTPCGRCDSCIELARDGDGSLDVIEIDAASHGGVDDARDLRDRAVLAPSRDRYKIFIIDEAHMVTPAGFNALLKVVEEPPEHVRFVFATTEPEKVIGTIRSRTHHFPFRLIPPALMLEYVEKLCAEEGVSAEAGVLPLVVRAGGGSARDTLSLLDQIIGGSEGNVLGYERAAALLGFTSSELLEATIEAFANQDAAAAFHAIDRIIQTGQDPRRFVEDLLERTRDLIVVVATGDGAGAVLRGTSADELDRLRSEAQRFQPATLARMAELIDGTLTEMTGVTSPRLHLELMVARVLVALRANFAGAVGGAGDVPAPVPTSAPASAPAAPSGPVTSVPAAPSALAADRAPATPAASVPATPTPAAEPEAREDTAQAQAAPASAPAAAPARAAEQPQPQAPAAPGTATAPASPEQAPAEVSQEQFQHAWPDILVHVKQQGGIQAWSVAMNVVPLEFRDGVFGFQVKNETVLSDFKEHAAEPIRAAVRELLSIPIKFRPQVLERRQAPRSAGDSGRGAAAPSRDASPAQQQTKRGPLPSWNVKQIPGEASNDGPGSAWDELAQPAAQASAPATQAAPASAPASTPSAPAAPAERDPLEGVPSDDNAPEIIAAREALARAEENTPQPFDPAVPTPADERIAREAGRDPVSARNTAPAEPATSGAAPAPAEPAPPIDDEPPYDEAVDGPMPDPGIEPALPPIDPASFLTPASKTPAPAPKKQVDDAPVEDAPHAPSIKDVLAGKVAADAEQSDDAHEETRAPAGTGPGFERYGEAVIRERLGARFVGEDAIVHEASAPEPEHLNEEP